MKPRRIQRKRTKGWRMPAGAVYVGRPTRWGNPFTVAQCVEIGFADNDVDARKVCVEAFNDWLTNRFQNWWIGPESERRLAWITEHIYDLRGQTVVCWCRLDQACHADVLLEVANA